MENERYGKIYDLCEENMNNYVLAHLNDGTQVDGIITDIDGDHVILAVPNIMTDQPMARQIENNPEAVRNRPYNPYYNYGPGAGYYGGYRPRPGYPGGYGGYGYGPGYYGSPYQGGGRFRRLVLPLAAIAAISTLPWF